MIVRGKVEGSELREPRAVPVRTASPTTAPLAPRRPRASDFSVATMPDIRFTGPVPLVAGRPVATDTLRELVGQPAFLRIARRDGRREIVAGHITSVSDGRITLRSFDVAAAQALAAPGDDFHIHAASAAGEPAVVLAPGDVVSTAVALPVAVGLLPRAGARRLDLRSRAQELVDDKARPGLTEETIDAHLVRDPEGNVYRSPSNRPVITASAAADLKAEQNAIVMALAGPLTRMFYDAARKAGIGEAAESHRPLWALHDNLTALAGQITVRFTRDLDADSPLGRAWKRLGAVHTLAQSHLPLAIVSESPTALLKQGMVTPVGVLTRLTEVANHFARTSGLKPSEIIRSSAPLVLKLAATHIKILESIDTDLGASSRDGAWSPESFRLVDGRLELTPEFIDTLSTTRGVRFDALPARTTGCPAAQSFNGSSPVRDFVALFAELVGKLEG